MRLIENPIENLIASRLSEKKILIQFILGPRQVGKSSAIARLSSKALKNKILTLSGDGVAYSTWIDEAWQQAKNNQQILAIDEIQKIPNWSEYIKKNWDSQKSPHQIKCILLGSSSLQLQQGLQESLTGRFEIIQAYHWSYSESKKLLKKMTLDDYLIYGGYPGSYDLIKNPKRWKNYIADSIVETVIGKDILTQAKVKSPALFRQTFFILMNLPAQVMSYHKMLGQLQDKGNIDLVKYYIQLYEAAFLIKTLQKFSKNEIKKKQSSPKIISMAPALCCFHRLDNLTPEFLGHVFESIVGAILTRHFETVYYWADGDYEVDFVIEYKNKIIAIEVKSGRQKKSISLEKFLKKYPQAKTIYVTKEHFNQFENDPVAFMTD